MSSPIVLDVFSDVACPWCFIGKRRLAKALEGREGVTVRWRAYQLNPDLPTGGVDAADYFARRFGGPETVRPMFERVEAVAREEGLAFDLAGQARVPNTRLAHRVIQLCDGMGRGDEAVEALFAGQFLEQADVTRLDVILDLLARHAPSVDRTRLVVGLGTDGGERAVGADLALARQLGITGVPTFVANGALGIGGAQDVDTLRAFLDEAARRPAGELARVSEIPR
jgi:predicted DsbA family dithiol-disulfide isomerase